MTGSRCVSGYVVLGGSSHAGRHQFDLIPVSSGGMAVSVALQPCADSVRPTVRPTVSVHAPCASGERRCELHEV